MRPRRAALVFSSISLRLSWPVQAPVWWVVPPARTISIARVALRPWAVRPVQPAAWAAAANHWLMPFSRRAGAGDDKGKAPERGLKGGAQLGLVGIERRIVPIGQRAGERDLHLAAGLFLGEGKPAAAVDHLPAEAPGVDATRASPQDDFKRQPLRRAARPMVAETGAGIVRPWRVFPHLGVLPGGGATLSAFSANTVEKKMSRTPEKFGHGPIAGVAGPEAANNAGAQASFIPLLTLGIPSNSIMAMMLGAMTIMASRPGRG
jgi:hypothetical protein